MPLLIPTVLSPKVQLHIDPDVAQRSLATLEEPSNCNTIVRAERDVVASKFHGPSRVSANSTWAKVLLAPRSWIAARAGQEQWRHQSLERPLSYLAYTQPIDRWSSESATRKPQLGHCPSCRIDTSTYKPAQQAPPDGEVPLHSAARSV